MDNSAKQRMTLTCSIFEHSLSVLYTYLSKLVLKYFLWRPNVGEESMQ